MDPNLFHQDYERLFEVLATVIVTSFFLERTLALVFEHRLFIAHFTNRGVKEPLAFAGALLVCRAWDFDAVSMTILAERTSLLGQVLTAGVVAGGSKVSVRLFHDVFKTMSTAEKQRKGILSPPLPGGGA